MNKSYSDKLKDPRWQKRRLLLLESAGFKCESCGDTEETLHVHHVYYEKDRDPWDYPIEAYLTLCSNCHKKWHNIKEGMDMSLMKVDVDQLKLIAGIVTQLKMMGPNKTLMFHDLVTGYHLRQIERNDEELEF